MLVVLVAGGRLTSIRARNFMANDLTLLDIILPFNRVRNCVVIKEADGVKGRIFEIVLSDNKSPTLRGRQVSGHANSPKEPDNQQLRVGRENWLCQMKDGVRGLSPK